MAYAGKVPQFRPARTDHLCWYIFYQLGGRFIPIYHLACSVDLKVNLRGPSIPGVNSAFVEGVTPGYALSFADLRQRLTG